MKTPMRWLSEYVETGLTAKELAHRMTMAGLEAEKIEEVGAGWDKVFVGYVTNVERHPGADRLVLATVDAGEHKLTVVTGAPNIAQGQKVALALAGARLIDGHGDSGEYKVLKPGGHFLSKTFQGGTEGQLLDLLKRNFRSVHHVKPPASREGSVELYLLAKGFRGRPGGNADPSADA